MNSLNSSRSPINFASRLEQQAVFFLVSVGVCTLTYGFFYVIDFLPEAPEITQTSERGHTTVIDNNEQHIATDTLPITNSNVPPPVTTSLDSLPSTIIIDALDKEIPIFNPESRSVSALDTALLSGVVRHPDSADFEREGTILILGHSSYLPNVINKNFQAFNGIQKLMWGDTIRLRSSDTEYVYRVDKVYEAKASDDEIEIRSGEARLTLATCNSFGTKDDRFIVEASLVSKKTL